MWNIGIPELAVILVGFGGPIWIALRAKPLGLFHYRWATYIAIMTGLTGLTGLLTVLSVLGSGRMDAGVVLFGLVVVLSALGSYGLFRRMRIGAGCAIASEVLVLLLAPLLDAIYARPEPTAAPGSGFPILILVVVNVVYFKKRWSTMRAGVFAPITKSVGNLAEPTAARESL